MNEVRNPSIASVEPPAGAARTKRTAIRVAAPRSVRIGHALRRAALVVLACGVIGGIVFAYLPDPIPVDLATVTIGPMQVTVDEDGRTRVEDRYTISSPLLATMARIELHPGDRVRTGQLIARLMPLDPPLLDARTRAQQTSRVAAALASREQAASTVARARAAFDYAQSEASRERALEHTGASAERLRERAELEVRTLRQDLASAQFAQKIADYEVQMARLAVERQRTGASAEQIDITAPVDGQVLRVLQESAGVVQPGVPLLELGNLEALEIVVDVLTSAAVAIRPGAKAAIEDWGGPQPMVAHVRAVEPSAFTRVSALGVEEQRVNVVLDLDAPREQWANLGDGYRVETRIEVWSSPAVLTAPASSVFRDRDQWAAFAVTDGRANLVTLVLGQRNGDQVEIVRGLEEGASVVEHPSERLTDGVAVKSR